MQQLKKTIRNKTIISAILIALICVVVFYITSTFAETELSTVRYDSIDSISSEQQILLNTELQGISSHILSLSDGIMYLEDDLSISNYLITQNSIYDFHSMYYIDINGNVISADEKPFNYENQINNAFTAQGQLLASNPYLDIDTGETMVNLQSPVFKSGELTGYVFVEHSLTPVFDHLSSVVSDAGYIVISDSSGDDLFSTDPNFVPLSELETELAKNGLSVSAVKDDLVNRVSRSFEMTIDDIERIAIYRPISFNDWSLVIVMEEAKVNADLAFVTYFLIIGTILTIFVALSFALYGWRAKKKVELVAYYDELTGLPNMDMFKKHIESVLKKNPNKDFVAVKFDVNDFKSINEMFGFDVGNKVLLAFQKTASITEESSFFIARAGNDEFIMFSGNGFLEELEKLTPFYEEYFKQTVPELIGYHLTFSYGRYFIDRGETDANEVVTKTSLAHSLAKNDRSKQVWNYDDDYKKQIFRHAEISSKMEKALQNREFVPFLQPKWSLKEDKLVGAEALVRWFEEGGKMIFPDIFIPLFETNGFIIQLDKYILNNVCKAIKSWIDKGIEPVPVSVNFSRANFYKESFTKDVKQIVDNHNIPHELIEIELTETTILDNEELFETILSNLAAENFKISIDDFGAGYSSLGMLKNLKVNTLKLDRSFLINKDEDSERGNKVIAGIIKLAHSIGMTIVAEGVEEKDQVDFLASLGCESAQGYYYSKPISCNDFEEKFFKIKDNT